MRGPFLVHCMGAHVTNKVSGLVKMQLPLCVRSAIELASLGQSPFLPVTPIIPLTVVEARVPLVKVHITAHKNSMQAKTSRCPLFFCSVQVSRNSN